jgi:hypothetical protein
VGTTRKQPTQLKYTGQLDNVTRPDGVRVENELHTRQPLGVKAQMTSLSKWGIRNQPIYMPQISCTGSCRATRAESYCQPIASMATLSIEPRWWFMTIFFFNGDTFCCCVGQWISSVTMGVFDHEVYEHIVLHVNQT